MSAYSELRDSGLLHGGRRHRSGRKKRDNIIVTFSISRAARAKLERLCAAAGSRPGQLISALLLRQRS
jgi:hypothetical protein